ncbi:MAG: histidine phosphatase family protein [Patescibacteria group bacterium]
MKVYLIRHAKTTDSLEGLHQRDDSPIIPDLIEETDFSDLKPEKVYSSPMLRARQTAEILFDTFEIVDFIYEATAPKLLYGKPKEFGRKFWEKHLPEFSEDSDWEFDGSESFNEVRKRAEKFKKYLEDQPFGSVAVVGHGTFFRHFIGVNIFGKDFSYPKYKEWLWPMEWENLEMKEIKL